MQSEDMKERKENEKHATEANSERTVSKAADLIQSITSLTELERIEEVVRKAKDNIKTLQMENFWEGKTPCWELSRCPDEIRDACGAFKYRYLPCWEIEGTFCKLQGDGSNGDSIEICSDCRVYKKFGNREPIILKSFGHGFNVKA